MKKKFSTPPQKKFFAAVLLTFALVLGTLPATAFAGPSTKVTYVEITVTEPVVGATPSLSSTVTADPADGARYYGLEWGVASEDAYNGGDPGNTDWDEIGENPVFEAGNYYCLMVCVVPNSGYYFDEEELAVTVNDEWPDAVVFSSLASNAIYVYYVFDLTGSAPAHTHSYNPDKWCRDASQHWHECTDANCPDKESSVKDTADHTFQWVIDREATTTEVGVKHEECTVCGYACSEDTEIAKLASANSNNSGTSATGIPQTGDTASLLIPLTALSVSAAAGTALYLRKKRAAK